MSVSIQQLANRLANAATARERISILSELQSFAKKNCQEVGKHTLQIVVELLKENGEPDEYIDALDLISRLVNPKYGDDARENATILLDDVMTVELLLDLLEHEDGLVAVMASEILTNVHSLESIRLESMIQLCPAGMTKLLNRVPDRSREEVSNQAIILIQQLTVSNEEMKKAVAFNEGFDTLFGIIESEGGVVEPGLVVQDCLQICCNVLSNSETCQRLFYDVGGGWHFKLIDFFSPDLLESQTDNQVRGLEINEAGSTRLVWFEQPTRLNCAVYAVKALVASLGSSSYAASKGKDVAVSSAADEIVRACSHWIVRSGPAELLPLCFSLLEMILSVKGLSTRIFDILLKFDESKNGVNIPPLPSLPQLHFTWSSPSAVDAMVISLPSLLADRYIFPCITWSTCEGTEKPESEEYFVALNCLDLLNATLSQNEMISGMVLQHILAPPPPDEFLDDLGINGEDASRHVEFGSAVINTLLKALGALDGLVIVGTINQSLQDQVDIVIKSSHLLALVFIHGRLLASELSTALSTRHFVDCAPLSSDLSISQPILTYLLSLVSRIVRLPVVGYAVATAVIRVLSTAACRCERASRQILENPSNLFVIDLASKNSENAGVPQSLQIECCFLLGCVFEAFCEIPSLDDPNALSRGMILDMIDSKIGLTRFNNLIKIPAHAKYCQSRSNDKSPIFTFSTFPEDVCFAETYGGLYKSHVNAIKTAMYSFYLNGDGSSDDDALSSEAKLLKVQMEHITELEMELKMLQSSTVDMTVNGTCQMGNESCDVNCLLQQVDSLTERNSELQLRIDELASQNSSAALEICELKSNLDSVDTNSLDLRLRLESEISEKTAEIALLKDEIVSLEFKSRQMADEAEEAKRALQLFDGDEHQNRIEVLENRNSELKSQIWEMESKIEAVHPNSSSMEALKVSVSKLAHLLHIESQNSDVQSLPLCIETCADEICRLSGRCSDVVECVGVVFDTVENEPVERIVECVEKLKEIIRLGQEKISDHDILQNELFSVENELEKTKGDYDTVFSRLCDVEEEVTSSRSSHEDNIKSYIEKISLLEKQNFDLSKKYEDATSTLSDVQESMKRNCEEYTVSKDLQSIELNKLLHEADSLRKSVRDHDLLAKSAAEMTVKLNHYENEIARLTDDNLANAELNSKLADEYAQLQHECEEVKKAYVCAESDVAILDELQSDFKNLAKHAGELQRQKEEGEEMLQECYKAKEVLSKSLSSKVNEYNSLLERFMHQKEELLNLSDKTNQLSLHMAKDCNIQSPEPKWSGNSTGKFASIDDVVQGLEMEIEKLRTEKDDMGTMYTEELQRVREEVMKLSADVCVREDELQAAKLKAENVVSPDIVHSVCFRLMALKNSVFGIKDFPDSADACEVLRKPDDVAIPALIAAMDEYLHSLIKHMKEFASSCQELGDATTSSWTTPIKGSTHTYVTTSPASAREAVRLHSDLRKERSRLYNLQEQHSEMLGLVAQQEIELRLYRQHLFEIGGSTACFRVEKEARVAATERYGCYVNFRSDGEGKNVVL